ncbi:MAG: twin-arginine translocation signal domain-containing protein [Deltaproteobacteria bacterium]|nr:twin-arginine translocation signal domain-containing protein [Deltaproteobacteria bacterium]
MSIKISRRKFLKAAGAGLLVPARRMCFNNRP